ncbi:MAG: hypothetical protein M3T55_12630 [Pseudomonadota bacterium]|nr:hypothetical protein [Pseudomonadota bacterium]
MAAVTVAFFVGKASDTQKEPTTPPSSTLAATTSPVPRRAIAVQPNVWVEWDSAKSGRSNTFAVDGLTIEASPIKTKDGFIPVIKIMAPNRPEVTLKGAENDYAESASINFGVGKFDSSSAIPQVVMTSFSGGAHCCLDIKLADFVNGAWRLLTVYELDTDQIDFPKDIDSDGFIDFVLQDDRFNYVFASHAGSWAPPLILDISHGRVVDVSKANRFRSLYEADFARTKMACETGKYEEDGKTYDTEINGACAAFVADGVRLGRGEEAWRFMLAHYDRSNGSGGDSNSNFLPTKCFVPFVKYECPAGKEHSFAAYPDALRWFLGDNGYLPAIRIAPNSPSLLPNR